MISETKLEAEYAEKSFARRREVIEQILSYSRKWLSPEAKKVVDAFKDDSDVALKIILRNRNDALVMARQLTVFVEDYLQEIE